MAKKRGSSGRRSAGTPAADPVEIAVGYGNVNFGDKTARLGITFGRGAMSIAQLDRTLVGRRLTVNILARAGGAQTRIRA